MIFPSCAQLVKSCNAAVTHFYNRLSFTSPLLFVSLRFVMIELTLICGFAFLAADQLFIIFLIANFLSFCLLFLSEWKSIKMAMRRKCSRVFRFQTTLINNVSIEDGRPALSLSRTEKNFPGPVAQFLRWCQEEEPWGGAELTSSEVLRQARDFLILDATRKFISDAKKLGSASF